MNLWNKSTKYLFHILMISITPSIYARFFFRNGDYPWNDAYTFFHMLVTICLVSMAHWSFTLASPSSDPGVIEWQHFRSAEDV